MDVTCDVDRTQFRNAARSLSASTNVTFRLWTDQTPGAPDTQLGPDYTVPLSALAVFKRHTDRYDGVKPRRKARTNAVIGSDASPVLLPANGVAWLDLTVGTTTIGCDFAEGASATARRRLQSVAFAREASHSETCETCITAPPPTDISARVFRSIAQSVPSATSTLLAFDSVRWDTCAMHSMGTPTRLTACTSGKYMIFAHVSFESNPDGDRLASLLLNGTTEIGRLKLQATSGGGPTTTDLSVATHYELSTGDYVEVIVTQTSGVPLDVPAFSQYSAEFGMVKLP